MGLNDVTAPVLGEMTIRVTSGSTAVEFERFLEYSYRQHYLEASDSWSFVLDQKELSNRDASVLVPGAIVEPCVNGHVQSKGILDEPSATCSRDEGSILHCSGRDWLSSAVDAQVDPQVRFVPSMTLLQLVTTAYGSVDPNIIVLADDIADRNVITGRIYGQRTTKKGKVPAKAILGQEKPYPNEGLFAFTSRVAQRFGLWIRPSVDGTSIILAAPDFGQQPRYGLCHALDHRSDQNNVERGTFTPSRKDQPSVIIAYGVGGGGNFAKTRLRAGIVNPVVDADNQAVFNAYPDVPFISVDPVTAAFPPIAAGPARPAFLYDPESHTQEQLEAFLRRELSLRMRKALTARYEIMGHELNGQPVAVNTIVSVLDQQKTVNWNGPLWVAGREFRKSARGGARSTIELLLPGALQF